MPSNRRYPLATCENPACERPYFTPHDKRQRFCSPQCNDNYHNDKRSLKEKNLKTWLKMRDIADEMINIAYLYLDYQNSPIDGHMLRILNVDLSLASIDISNQAGQQVLWFVRYGLCRLTPNDDMYKILCRNNL